MSAVVNYKYPNTAAPGAGNPLSMVVAECVFTDLDTGAVITHNFGLSGLSPSTDLGSDLPIVLMALKTAPTTTVSGGGFQYALTDSSTVTVSKIAQIGSLATLVVTILRPHTFMR